MSANAAPGSGDLGSRVMQGIADAADNDLTTDQESDVDTDLPGDGPGDNDLTTDQESDVDTDVPPADDGPGDADFTNDGEDGPGAGEGDGAAADDGAAAAAAVDDGGASDPEDGPLPNTGAEKFAPLIAAIGALALVSGTWITRRVRRI